MGVITEFTLQCVKKFHLKRVYRPLGLDEALASLDVLSTENAYFKVWWLAHSENTRLFILNPTDEHLSSNLELALLIDSLTNRVANGLFYMAAGSPLATKWVSQLLALLANTHNEIVGPSYRMLTWPMPYQYMEAEWFFPASLATKAFLRYKELVTQHKCSVNYVSEIRFIQQDNIWLSPNFVCNSYNSFVSKAFK